MSTLSINRRRIAATTATAKETLRHHIEQLSLDQQWDFILNALQLISDRPQLRPAAVPIDNRRQIAIRR